MKESQEFYVHTAPGNVHTAPGTVHDAPGDAYSSPVCEETTWIKTQQEQYENNHVQYFSFSSDSKLRFLNDNRESWYVLEGIVFHLVMKYEHDKLHDYTWLD